MDVIALNGMGGQPWPPRWAWLAGARRPRFIPDGADCEVFLCLDEFTLWAEFFVDEYRRGRADEPADVEGHHVYYAVIPHNGEASMAIELRLGQLVSYRRFQREAFRQANLHFVCPSAEMGPPHLREQRWLEVVASSLAKIYHSGGARTAADVEGLVRRGTLPPAPGRPGVFRRLATEGAD
jgi:hypothetical protein